MRKLLAKSLLVIIEAGIEVVAERPGFAAVRHATTNDFTCHETHLKPYIPFVEISRLPSSGD